MSELSGYRLMWLVALFDLPTNTKAERREASLFRKELLAQGFTMMQFSVYLKYCRDGAQAKVVTKGLEKIVPPGGRLDVISITDKQYAAMVSMRDDKRFVRENPTNLTLF